jgi:hypothetical protein
LPVSEPGEQSQNATSEAKITHNRVIAKAQGPGEVMANSNPTPRLDKRAIEAKDQRSTPGLKRRVLNPKMEEANPSVNPGLDNPSSRSPSRTVSCRGTMPRPRWTKLSSRARLAAATLSRQRKESAPETTAPS